MKQQSLEPVQQNISIPITSLYGHKKNYRQHPPEQIKKLKASLERWGQVRSIVAQVNADGTYTIVAGHGLVQAAQELVDANTSYYERFGKMRIDVIPSSWSSEQVSGYLVADNNLSVDAVDDDELLATLLQEQSDAGFDLASLGTDDETLRQMLGAMEDDLHDAMRVNQEQVLDGSDRKLGTTPEEYLERYESTDIRQIMLIYDKLEYVRIAKLFTEIRTREKLETNTEVVTLLLNAYAQEHDLEEALC